MLTNRFHPTAHTKVRLTRGNIYFLLDFEDQIVYFINSHTTTATNQEDIQLERDEKRFLIENMTQNIKFQANSINS